MFVENLNLEQQKLLLVFARKVMEADGKITEVELSKLEAIKSQCHPKIQTEILESFEPIQEISALEGKFSNKKEKISFLLELIGMALANFDYHENQELEIRRIAEVLNISSDLLDDLENWVIRLARLLSETQSMMED